MEEHALCCMRFQFKMFYITLTVVKCRAVRQRAATSDSFYLFNLWGRFTAGKGERRAVWGCDKQAGVQHGGGSAAEQELCLPTHCT